MNGLLPEGWTTARVDDLIEPGGLFDGPFGSNLKTSDYTDAGVRVIRLENIGHIRFIEDRLTYISSNKYRTLTKHTIRAGDVIVGSFVDGAVRVCVLPVLPTQAIAKADCFCVRTRAGLADRRFVAYQLGTNDTRDVLMARTHGATRPRINTRQLRDTQLLIAPRAEQERIATRLDELVASIESCKTRLRQVRAILKRFRQSVLAAACAGRLTADWRESNTITESVDAILHIAENSRRKAATTPTQQAKCEEIFSVAEENNGEELPDSWRYVTLAKLCVSFDYGTSTKSSRTGKVPVLRMGNIQNGEIDWTNLVYTSDRTEIGTYSLQPSTVLFNRTNSPELVGKTAIYRGDKPALFAGYLIRINPIAQLDPEYLNYCLNSAYARDFCARVKTDGVSQSNINAQRLGTFEVPFCSPAEQREIVRRVKDLFAIAERIENRLSEIQTRADRLVPSLLAKAFRGELVPTEAALARREGRTYEPASVLLERLRSARPVGAGGAPMAARPRARIESGTAATKSQSARRSRRRRHSDGNHLKR